MLKNPQKQLLSLRCPRPVIAGLPRVAELFQAALSLSQSKAGGYRKADIRLTGVCLHLLIMLK